MVEVGRLLRIDLFRSRSKGDSVRLKDVLSDAETVLLRIIEGYMTAEEAKANQDRIAEHHDLGHWYGTRCEKCCGVYPKFRTKDTFDPQNAYYECEVCGKRTKLYTMPWLAEQAWNNHEYESDHIQMTLGEFIHV